MLSSQSTIRHVPTATSVITKAHAIATTSLGFSVPAFPIPLDPQNADFAGVRFPLYRDSVFKVHAYAIHTIYIATRFTWPLRGPFPLGQLYSTTA